MSVQLAARGHQDIYITGKPSMTYFKTRYRQYTPFVTEYIEYTFQTTPSPNYISTFTIPLRGDVLTDVTLKLTFPALYNITSSVYCYPTFPTDMVTIQVYVLTNTGATLAFQAGQFGYYYSTYNIHFWTTPFVSDLTVSYNSQTNKFEFVTTNPGYVALGFPNEQSASFWGFDILNKTYNNVLYYGFAFNNLFITSQLNLTQAGWIQGFTPRGKGEGFNYDNCYATSTIKEARLFVGGQIVSRISGDYVRLFNDYSVAYENQSGLTALTGKNDTSIKYASTTSYVKIPFGLDTLPICALSRNDVKIEVDFLNPNLFVTSAVTGSGSISDSASYTTADFRTIFNVSSYSPSKKSAGAPNVFVDLPTAYGNVVTWQDLAGGFVTYDTTKPIADPTAYTRVQSNNIPYGAILNGKMYYWSGLNLTVMPVSDYFKNINSRVTSSVLIWKYDTSGGDFTGIFNGGITVDSRYVYISMGITGFYLPFNSVRVGVSSQYYSGQICTFVTKFYGLTTVSASSGAGLEFIRRLSTNCYSDLCPVAATPYLTAPVTLTTAPTTLSISVSSSAALLVGQYVQLPGTHGAFVTGIVGTTITIYITRLLYTGTIPINTFVNFRTTPTPALVSQSTSGSDCVATWTFTLLSGADSFAYYSIKNFVICRYDTTKDFNSSSSYDFYQDFNTLFPTIPLPLFDFADFQFYGYTEGRYIYSYLRKQYGAARTLYKIDSINFMSSSGHSATDVSTISGVNISGAPYTDGNWLYFCYNNEGYMSRLIVGADISLSSSWENADVGTILPSFYFAPSEGGKPRYLIPKAYNGTYVYYIGDKDGNNNSPYIAVYDTTKPFSSASSWQALSKHWALRINRLVTSLNVQDSSGGSTSENYVSSIASQCAVDSLGNFYVTQQFTGIAGTYTIYNSNGTQATSVTFGSYEYMSILIKYNSNGNYVWYMKIYNVQTNFRLKTDSSNNLYIVGSGISLITNSDGSQYYTGVGRYQMCLIKITNGTAVWTVTTAGLPDSNQSSGVAAGFDISIDGSGNIYLVGTIAGPGFQGNGYPMATEFISAGASTPYAVISNTTGTGIGVYAKLSSAGAFQFVNYSNPNNVCLYSISYDTVSAQNFVCGNYNNSTLTWNTTTGANHPWWTIAWSPGVNKWVATTYGTSRYFAWSSDGYRWYLTSIPINFYGYSCAWSPGLSMFAAIQATGNIGLYSSDALTWNQFTLPVSASWSGVAWSSGPAKFVAVAYASTSAAYSSTGSGTWSSATMPSTASWYAVAANSTTYVAVAAGGTQAAYSTTGTGTWTATAMPVAFTGYAVEWSPSLSMFLAVGNGTTGYLNTTGQVATWTAFTLPATQIWWSVASSENTALVVAVGGGSTGAYSTTGTGTWNSMTMPAATVWRSVKWSTYLGMFVAISSSTNMIAYSGNGQNWSLTYLPSVTTTISPTLSPTTTMNGFVAKFSTTGTITNIQNIPPTDNSSFYLPSVILTDTSGNYYVGGSSKTSLLGATLQCYIHKYNSSYTKVWTITITGAAGNQSHPHMVKDSSGNIYVSLSFESTLVSVTDATGTVVKTYTREASPYIYNVYCDAIILKFDANGIFLFGSLITGNLDQIPYGLAIDTSDNVIWSGIYTANDLVVYNSDGTIGASITTKAALGELNGGANGLFFKMNSSGKVQWYISAPILFDNNFITSSGQTIDNLLIAKPQEYTLVQGNRYYYIIPVAFYQDTSTNYPTILRFDPFGPPTTSLTASVLVEYTYLGKDEIKYLKNNLQIIPYEYMQSMSVQCTPGTTVIPLQFIGPVKELYVRSNTFSSVTSFKLTFNDQDLFTFSNKYLSIIQPFETAVTMPSDNTYMYTFGTPINMSRIASKVLTVTQSSTITLWIYAKSINVLGVQNGVSSLLFNSRQYLV